MDFSLTFILGLKTQARGFWNGDGVTVWRRANAQKNVDLEAKIRGVICVFD